VRRFIAVAGNIGAGKSTLVERLCDALGWKPYFEPVAQNPYLEDFYRDMGAWAFHSQVFFLSFRMKSHHQLLALSTPVVQDRSVYEDAEIFAENLYRQGHISERDYQTYRNLYDLFISLLAPPDLVVYLRTSVPVLAERIVRRGRDFEANIDTAYLDQLNTLYEQWISGYSLSPVLTVDSDSVDFSEDRESLLAIAERAEAAMEEKQSMLFPIDSGAGSTPKIVDS
jgi:deoxyadenosine/deoxycytidine kinase